MLDIFILSVLEMLLNFCFYLTEPVRDANNKKNPTIFYYKGMTPPGKA